NDKVAAVEFFGYREELTSPTDHHVFPGFLLIAQLEHANSSQDQKPAENIKNPMVMADEFGADADHQAAHEQSAEDTPEQDTMLIERRNTKEAENRGDDEHIVDAERFLNHIP